MKYLIPTLLLILNINSFAQSQDDSNKLLSVENIDIKLSLRPDGASGVTYFISQNKEKFLQEVNGDFDSENNRLRNYVNDVSSFYQALRNSKDSALSDFILKNNLLSLGVELEVSSYPAGNKKVFKSCTLVLNGLSAEHNEVNKEILNKLPDALSRLSQTSTAALSEEYRVLKKFLRPKYFNEAYKAEKNLSNSQHTWNQVTSSCENAGYEQMLALVIEMTEQKMLDELNDKKALNNTLDSIIKNRPIREDGKLHIIDWKGMIDNSMRNDYENIQDEGNIKVRRNNSYEA